MKILYIIAGGSRTLKYTIDSIFKNVIIPFSDGYEYDVLYYLKSSDPGPKQQLNKNFVYKDVNKDDIIKIIGKYKQTKTIILDKDEFDDKSIYKFVNNRDNFIGFLDQKLDDDDVDEYGRPYKRIARMLQYHYNILRCGDIIDKEMNNKYDWIVWLRPDLQFLNKLDSYKKFSPERIYFSKPWKNKHSLMDHFSIIPYKLKDKFFKNIFNFYNYKGRMSVRIAEQLMELVLIKYINILNKQYYIIKRP